MAISLKKDNTKSYKSSTEKITESKIIKLVPLKEKMKIFEKFSKTGEKITGKTIFDGYPIGQWAIQIRSSVKRTKNNKKHEINATEEQLRRLEEMGILERQIESTIDEKIDALIEWKAKYPKAKMRQHTSNEVLEEYAKTEEEYKKLLEEYEKMQKYYEYIRKRKTQNKLTKKQFIKCKEGNVGGIFKYPTKVEKLAKKYGVTENNIDNILINYGTIENFYKVYKKRKLKSQDDVILAGVMIKSVLDLDFNYNKGRYDKLYKAIIKKEDEDPELNLYFSEKLKEELQGLTERERFIIESLFGLTEENLPATYTDIGKNLEVTGTRIRDIEKDVLSRLGKKLEKFDFNEQKLRDTLTTEELKGLSNLEEKLDDIRLSNINMDDDETIKYLNILKSIIYKPTEVEEKQPNKTLVEEKNLKLDKSPKLEELGFSIRIINALERKNIKTLNQISNMTYKELSQIRNLGKKSIEEIISKLEEYGFDLREENNTTTKNLEEPGKKESLIKRIIQQQKIISEQQSEIDELTSLKKEL